MSIFHLQQVVYVDLLPITKEKNLQPGFTGATAHLKSSNDKIFENFLEIPISDKYFWKKTF